jgi:hypothetical protein
MHPTFADVALGWCGCPQGSQPRLASKRGYYCTQLSKYIIKANCVPDHTLATGPMNPLEKVLSRYQAIVRDLLSRQNVTGTSLDKLASFRETHRDFAYTCRLGGCRRKAVGFETEKLRDQHEEAHRPVLRCEADGCQYPAFPSVNALRRHVKDLHTETRKYRSIRQTNAEKMPGDVRQPFSLVMAGPKSPPPAMIPRQAASHPAMMEDDGSSYQPTSWDESQQRSLRPFGEDTKIKPISWPSKFQGVSDRSSEPIPKEEDWFLEPIFEEEDWFPQEKLEVRLRCLTLGYFPRYSFPVSDTFIARSVRARLRLSFLRSYTDGCGRGSA